MFKKGYEKEIKQIVKQFSKDNKLTREQYKIMNTYTLNIFECHIKNKGAFTRIEYDTIDIIIDYIYKSLTENNLLCKNSYEEIYDSINIDGKNKNKCNRLSIC